MEFDFSTPDDISDKQKLARGICGLAAGLLAGKLVNLVFNSVIAYRKLDELTVE